MVHTGQIFFELSNEISCGLFYTQIENGMNAVWIIYSNHKNMNYSTEA